MDLMVNPTITKFAQKVDGTITELKLGQKQEDAYKQIYDNGKAEGSADLENNKAATINVSTYTQPVEITPTSGKDGMKKATVTLSNIPSPSGSFTFYGWSMGSDFEGWTLSETPQVGDTFYPHGYEEQSMIVFPQNLKTIESVGEGTITVDGSNYARFNMADITFPMTPTP